MIHGPGTYFPRVEEKVLTIESALNIKKGEALKLKAKEKFFDRKADK